jgi:hypothetical protein
MDFVMSIASSVISCSRFAHRFHQAGSEHSVEQPEIVKKGYLYKLSSWRHWKRRWFILDVKYLSYYESPSDRTPLNRVLLKELSISKADPAALAQYEKEHLIIVDIKSSDRFELHLLLLLLLLFFFFIFYH